jgi:murein DD-endopeptidase MepM/ murein hydrolase activator NlpD
MQELYQIVPNQIPRGCNVTGCGSFGAGRGSRQHQGIDYNVSAGQPIYAPFDGVLTRNKYRVYQNSRPELVGIEIKSKQDYTMKMFYVTTSLANNQSFKAGEIIAYAQDMAQYYSEDMPNHVHVEIKSKQGIIQDFTNWFTKGFIENIVNYKNIISLVSIIAIVYYLVSKIKK